MRTDARIAGITGTYNRATIRFPRDDWEQQTLVVSRRGQHIGYACNNDEWCELVPVTDELFRRRKESVATTAIVAMDGQMIMQGAVGNWRKPDE